MSAVVMQCEKKALTEREQNINFPFGVTAVGASYTPWHQTWGTTMEFPCAVTASALMLARSRCWFSWVLVKSIWMLQSKFLTGSCSGLW